MRLWIQAGAYFIASCLVYGYQVDYSENLRNDLLLLPYRAIRIKIVNWKNHE